MERDMLTRFCVITAAVLCGSALAVAQEDPTQRDITNRFGRQGAARHETPAGQPQPAVGSSPAARAQLNPVAGDTRKFPVAISTEIPVPWSPPIRSPIWSGTIDTNPRNTSTGQGEGRFGGPRGPNRIHTGVDQPAPVGTAVHPVAPGVVEFADWQKKGDHNSGAGYHVRIRHTEGPLNGFRSTYMHLQPGNSVKAGDKVTPDDVVGRVGRTGNVPKKADPHLHIQMKDANGTFVVPNLQPYSGRPPSPSSGSGAVGGILINPTPQRDNTHFDQDVTSRILRDRPGTKGSWRIQLPE